MPVLFKLVRKMKYLVLCVVFFLLLAGAKASEYNVGVVWAGKSSMSERVLYGFEYRLKELKVDVDLDVQSSLKDIDTLDRTVKAFEAEGKDALVVLRSNGSAYLGANPPSIPTFIGGGNLPSELGSVKNMDAPEGNVTGVTYYLPIEVPLESYLAITPKVKSFLLINQKGYPSSAIDWKGTEKTCKALNLKCANGLISSREELVELVKDRISEFDAVILGNQALAFENVDAILEHVNNKPIYSYAAEGVKRGALGGVVADDVKLGSMLADSFFEVIINNKPIKTVPVKMDDKPAIILNAKAIDNLKLEISPLLLNFSKFVDN